jgi:hypothetical protein
MLLMVKITPQSSQTTITDVNKTLLPKGFTNEADFLSPPNSKALCFELHDGEDPKKYTLAEVIGSRAIQNAHTETRIECYLVAEEIWDSIRASKKGEPKPIPIEGILPREITAESP